MAMEQLWVAVGELVVQPAYDTKNGINADLLMVAAGSLLGALIARIADKETVAKLNETIDRTCEEKLGRPLGSFDSPLPELPFDVASEIIVRIMPDLEKLSSLSNLAAALAAWIGTWAAEFDQYGIPSEEFIAVSLKFAETAANVDSWNIHDEKSGDLIGTWASS